MTYTAALPSPTINTATQDRRGARTTRGEVEQCEGSKATQDRGHHEESGGQHKTRGNATAHHSRHSTRPPHKHKGDANTQTGDTDIRRGVSNTAALHSPCHPPSAMPPHHPQWPHPPPRRGGSRQRIPHHTNSTDTHSPPTHHTPGTEQSTTRQQYR